MRHGLYKLSSTSVVCLALLFGLQACEKKYDAVIDTPGGSPIIAGVTLSPAVINTDTMNIGSVRQPDDTLTIRVLALARVFRPPQSPEIQSLKYTLTDPGTSLSLAEGVLLNDGQQPDQSSADSTYSGTIEFRVVRAIVGKFIATLSIENNSIYQSNIVEIPIQIYRLNHPPVLSNLEMDTLISLDGADHVLQLRVTATDSDGQPDILRVYFNSYKPDSSAASGNPFSMYDDGRAAGASGDAIPGDGIYGLRVLLPATTTIGTYRFEFHALDKSLDSSNVIIQSIRITN